MTQKHFGGRLFRLFCINMGFMMRKSSSIFLNFVDDITQQKISVHNEKTFQVELLKLIPPESLEQKYGGSKPVINDNYFPPDMSMPGKRLLTMDEVRQSYSTSIRSLIPWVKPVPVAQPTMPTPTPPQQ